MENKMKHFVEELAKTQVTPNVYNQYSYQCKENEARRDNLLLYLKNMYKLKPSVMLIGEAPGYRGCRLTGVPFTSEHLIIHGMDGLKLFGEHAGYRLAARKDKLLKEATATIIWETMIKNDLIPLAWNAFPFHPHKDGDGQSNRTPLKSELIIGESSLLAMVDMFGIKRVVAVGNKADETLKKLHIPCYKVRHPAQGGKNDFVQGIMRIKQGMACGIE